MIELTPIDYDDPNWNVARDAYTFSQSITRYSVYDDTISRPLEPQEVTKSATGFTLEQPLQPGELLTVIAY